MHRNALQTIEQYHMLEMGDHVVVGFSGGADSVALLYFLHTMSSRWQLHLTACHVNHNLRGQEAKRDEDFCRSFCRRHHIPLEVYQIQAREEAEKAGLSVEEYSRQARYRIFEQVAQARNAKIATAHTLSDQAETLLFYIARGTGLHGLGGIPAVRGNIIRPLLACTREEIEEYCRQNQLNFVTDSTNFSEIYTRNKIRHSLVPIFRELNPAFYESVQRLCTQAAMESSYMEQQAADMEQKICVQQTQVRAEFCRTAFLQLHPAMQRQLAARWLRQYGAQISAKKVEDLVVVAQSKGTLEIVKDIYFTSEKQLVFHRKQVLQPYFQIPFTLGENAVYSNKKVYVLLWEYKNIENNCQGDLKNTLDYDKINHTAVIRQRQNGDKIALQGAAHTRPLKKLFNEAKLPLQERARRLVVADDAGPLWVEGFGVAKRAAPTKESKYVVTIKVEGSE